MRRQLPLKRQFVLLIDPKSWGRIMHGGCVAHAEAPGLVRRKGLGGGMGKSLYCSFFRKKQVRQGEQNRIGQQEKFLQALGQRGCPSLSSTWPWGDQGRRRVVLNGRALVKEGVGVGQFAYERLTGNLFAISRSQFTLGGAGPPGLVRTQMSKYQKIEDMANITGWGRDTIKKS